MNYNLHQSSQALLVLIALLVLPLFEAQGAGLDRVSLDDPGIVVRGTQFASLQPDGLHFDRFDDTILGSTTVRAKVNPERARNTSGVILSLYSNAPVIRLSFAFDPGQLNRGSQFGVYRNGVWVREVAVGKDAREVVIELMRGTDADQAVHHEVVLPSWSNPILQGIGLTEGYALETKLDQQLPKIVFLGDSISHGTGQGSASYKTYPFIASRKLGMEGFNLAVGGGQISPPVADLLQHFGPVQVVWILVGYNNWQGVSQDLDTIRQEYEALLSTVRMRQPEAEVFCCTLTYTRREVDAESGVRAGEVRKAVADIVNQRILDGDTRLHLVRAEEWTDEGNLRPTDDPVHFSVEGAAKFAEVVYRTVRAGAMR